MRLNLPSFGRRETAASWRDEDGGGAGASPEPGAGAARSPSPASSPGETTLDLVPVGHQADIVRVGGHKAVKRRLMEMGLVRGERVRVQRVAPLGDPIELRVKGYDLAVRRSEARSVVVSLAFPGPA